MVQYCKDLRFALKSIHTRRIARKHVKAYLQRIAVDALQISAFNELETPRDQTSFLRECADADARMRAA